MQVILGANGVIARGLAKNLTAYTDKIRLVSRNPVKVNEGDEIFSADLTNIEQTLKAVEGTSVAYLTVGLKYDIKIWQVQWPIIMKNVIDACINHNTKLVFFDNVYLYGKVDGWMTEQTPVNPSSKKGEVRAKISEMIINEFNKGSLKAIIARSADFYGPNTPLSFVNAMVFERYRNGKKAQWLMNDKVFHSFTYTPDAGKATAILGNTESVYNQVWHLPTDRNVMTGKEFIEIVASSFHIKPKYTNVKKWMMKMIGLFNGIISESVEMLYQSEFDYLFDSSKFEKEFNFQPTSYQNGIEETVKSMQK
ncbi:MAG: NAD-dependent epimerase/dehydratase family protein [Ignavibacteriae bacterium]|nr:NAD-dependent epimerase/dehydratase family protein [Ignavibacteriota bacterium]